MHKYTLALDWTPNINHIGFFIAQAKNYYKDLGLELSIVDPASDNYQRTPAKKVELGLADFALCPTESIISYRTKSKPFNLLAIAGVLREDLSAIAVKTNKRIGSPKDLDGKLYSSYQARYEDEIVREMIKNDGGAGTFQIGYPNKLGIWETVLNDSFDATWVFLNWEGVEAESLGASLKYFKMKDYGVPYSYSPVIAVDEEKLEVNKVNYRKFLEGSKQGFLFCKEHPDEAIEIFKKFVPNKDAKINLAKALAVSVDAFGKSSNWGHLDEEVIEDFLHWIYAKGLEKKNLDFKDIATNALLVE
jgi:ABC-type nitrate/sulfonate/bicarbonate transport system substrate-binding protein